MKAPGPLTLRLLPLPDFAKLTPVQKHQFQYILGYTGNLPESLSLMEFFSVHEEKGKHVYDMHLFCEEDGQVFAANTKKRIGGFSQGGADFGNTPFDEAFEAAVDAYRAAKKAATAKPAAKKPSAKKVSAKKPSAKEVSAKKPAAKKVSAKTRTKR